MSAVLGSANGSVQRSRSLTSRGALAPGAERPGATRQTRNFFVVAGVVLGHAAALWTLSHRLPRHADEIVVPVAMLGQIIVPPAAQQVLPAQRPVPRENQPLQRTDVRPVQPQPVMPLPPVPPLPSSRVPSPLPSVDAPATANAPAGASDAPAPAAPPAAAAANASTSVAAAPAPPAPPAPAKVELPSTDADYLQNPRPPYPPLSKRLGEQGQVVLRVLIGADGAAQRAEVRQSSSFDRLDQAALATVLKWRYVPGRRAGVAEAMWFNVPINFVLE